MICIRGRVTFSEALKLTKLKKSTLWDCVERLRDLGMIGLEKVITVVGPRTMLICKKEGINAVKELEDALKGEEV